MNAGDTASAFRLHTPGSGFTPLQQEVMAAFDTDNDTITLAPGENTDLQVSAFDGNAAEIAI